MRPPPSRGGDGSEEETGTPRWEGGCHVRVCVLSPAPPPGPLARSRPACVPPCPPPLVLVGFFYRFLDLLQKN